MSPRTKKNLKNILEKFKSIFSYSLRLRRRIEDILISILPPVTILDIGASYFPHIKWRLFLNSKETDWYAIDPNEHNLNYTNNWIWNCKINKLPTAVFSISGKHPFYITNIDSGSSLLEPSFNANIEHRSSRDYFIPYKKVKLETKDINEIFRNNIKTPGPYVIKLDTQGTEFDIVKSLNSNYLEKILCFEMESNLHAEPAYKNSSHISEVFNFFHLNGYELMDIDIIRNQNKLSKNNIKSRYIPNECDLVFMKKSKLVRFEKLNNILTMLGLYFSYGLYEEMIFLSDFLIKNHSLEPNLKKDLIEILKILK